VQRDPEVEGEWPIVRPTDPPERSAVGLDERQPGGRGRGEIAGAGPGRPVCGSRHADDDRPRAVAVDRQEDVAGMLAVEQRVPALARGSGAVPVGGQ
jgi:hypothetical protein